MSRARTIRLRRRIARRYVTLEILQAFRRIFVPGNSHNEGI